MLSVIKEMIATKNTFLEAADMLFEDGSTNIDSTIVLGEETEEAPIDGEIEEDGNPEDVDNDDVTTDDNDPMDNSIDDNTPAPSSGEDTGSDDMLDSPIDSPAEEPMPLPGNDIPTPVGRQTGEPIDGVDDIFNTEIDLRSNTMKDTLPIPPASAGDAVAENDDNSFMNQRIDSGYGESDSSYTEAITLDGDGSSDSGSSDTASEDTATGSEGGDESTPDDNSGDNTVTSAVKDKVDEMSSDSSADLGSDSSNGGISQDKKDEVMKKLSSVTKNLEDAKKAIIDAV